MFLSWGIVSLSPFAALDTSARTTFDTRFRTAISTSARTALSTLNTLRLSALSGSIKKAHAQNNPDISGTTVSGIIPIWDTTPPSTPILIAPENGLYLNYQIPTFIWQESIDAFGIDNPEYGMEQYLFFLNGVPIWGDIPLVSTETPDYSLIYDPILGRYSLTPKQPLPDGIYTWKIRAIDYFENYADSVTWTFTIDTQAPFFIVTDIAEAEVSISAQDPNSIPNEPVRIETNRPLIKAIGEPNSTVALTVIIPNQSNLNYTTTIAPDGTWQIELPLLPRDVIIELSFIITDLAGNVSVLQTIPFIIVTPTIEIPLPTLPPGPTPTPSPSPTPTVSPSPTPEEEPEDKEPEEIIPSPSPTPGPPTITIPLLPPEEIAHGLISEISKLVPLTFVDLVGMITQGLPDAITKPISEATPYAALLVAGFVPALAITAVAAQFGSNLSLLILARILQAFGLFPKGKPKGLVFDSKTQEPIAFALVTIYQLKENTYTQLETVITNVDGIYNALELPIGTYKVVVSHPEYQFPSQRKAPKGFGFEDYYQAQEFEVTEDSEEIILLIPMDAQSSDEKSSISPRKVRIQLARLSRVSSKLTMPLFFISGLLVMLFPSIWNLFVFICYLFLISKKITRILQTPSIKGVVADVITQEGVEHAIIRLVESQSIAKSDSEVAKSSQRRVTLLRTNRFGEFEYFGKRSLYQVQIMHQEYIWIDQNRSPLSIYEIDTRTENQFIIATMQPMEAIYEELFS